MAYTTQDMAYSICCARRGILYLKPVLWALICGLTLASCEQEPVTEPVNQPKLRISTKAVKDISTSGAISGGNIDAGQIEEITACGVCWGKNSNPTANDDKALGNLSGNVFRSEITGLEPNSTYYARAYAIAGNDTVYGYQQYRFTTLENIEIVIPDPVFRGYCYKYFDNAPQDGILTLSEVEKVSTINNLSTYRINNQTINSLEGIQYFTGLRTLSCININVTTLDLSGMPALRNLYIQNTPVGFILLDGCSELVSVRLEKVPGCILTLNPKEHPNLQSLHFNEWTNTRPVSLDLRNFEKLEVLDCTGTLLKSLKISGCTNLKRLAVSDTQITNLYLNEFKKLEVLACGGWDAGCRISSLDIRECKALKELYLGWTPFASLDLSGFESLSVLQIQEHSLNEVNLSGCKSLKGFVLYGNSLKSLNVDGCTALETLDVSVSKSFSCLDCPSLKSFRVSLGENTNVAFDLRNMPSLNEVSYTNAGGSAKELDLTGSDNMTWLWISNTTVDRLGLANKHGLKTVGIYNIPVITELDFSDRTSLRSLDLGKCANLSSLKLDRCTSLEELNLGYDGDLPKLKSADVSTCASLTTLGWHQRSVTVYMKRGQTIPNLYLDASARISYK